MHNVARATRQCFVERDVRNQRVEPTESDELLPLVAMLSLAAPVSAVDVLVSPDTTAPPLAPLARFTPAHPAVATATTNSNVRMGQDRA